MGTPAIDGLANLGFSEFKLESLSADLVLDLNPVSTFRPPLRQTFTIDRTFFFQIHY